VISRAPTAILDHLVSVEIEFKDKDSRPEKCEKYELLMVMVPTMQPGLSTLGFPLWEKYKPIYLSDYYLGFLNPNL
jgi:hypothetical protein